MKSAAVLLAILLAQQAPPPRTFKTGVNVVEVDIVVTDKAGRPARGLQKDDFEVFEDGGRVDVAAFSAVDVPDTSRIVAVHGGRDSGSFIATNDQPHEGRVFLIALDDYHLSLSPRRLATAKSIARRLVERMGPFDQAAVIATSGQIAAQAEFTADKERLIGAINGLTPQSEHRVAANPPPPGPFSGPDSGFTFIAEIKTRWAMDALSRAASALAKIPHRRKAVLLVSQGVPVSLEQIITNLSAGSAWQALREFIVTAQRSNIAVYAVDPCGLDLDRGCSAASRQNLRTIAEGTGGFAVTNTNAPEIDVDRIAEENGAYYIVRYYSPARANDGKMHRIQVRVRVPGLQVRARQGYLAPKDPRSGAAVAETPVDALLRAPLQARGLTMRLIAIPVPVPVARTGAVVVDIDLHGESSRRAKQVAFGIIALDQSGNVRAQQRFTTSFPESAGSAGAWARFGLRLEVPPGRYHLRVAAAGEYGAQGSVFTEVDVPAFDRDLAVGGLSLGLQTSAGSERAGEASLLPLPPLTTLELPPGSEVEAQLPIRIASKAASKLLSLSAKLVDLNGATTLLEEARLRDEYASATGSVYRLALPKLLAAGEYQLVVTTTLDRARVTREVRFRITPTAAAVASLPITESRPIEK